MADFRLGFRTGVFQISLFLLGSKGPLLRISEIANALWSRRKYDEVEKFHNQTFSKMKKVIGMEHLDYLVVEKGLTGWKGAEVGIS